MGSWMDIGQDNYIKPRRKNKKITHNNIFSG